MDADSTENTCALAQKKSTPENVFNISPSQLLMH